MDQLQKHIFIQHRQHTYATNSTTIMGISASFLFSAMDVQTASKKDLMCIKGIGEKKATEL